MAQGLNVRSLTAAKSPPMALKTAEQAVKRTRGAGSRRIFSPQFKLQVLESYRSDVDCRGNQRATARKYNIHRRQIQKWLQCEESLRTSVEESSGSAAVKAACRDAICLTTTTTTSSSPSPSPSSSSSSSSSEEEDKKKQQQQHKTYLTLNRSATAFARLGDDAERIADDDGDGHGRTRPNLRQGSSGSTGPASKVQVQVDHYLTHHHHHQQGPDSDSRTETENLKRVAQKLYPCLPGGRISVETRSVDHERQHPDSSGVSYRYFSGGNGAVPARAYRSPSPDQKRDDNFNRLDVEGPLDLKSKVRSETLPEEFPALSLSSSPSPSSPSSSVVATGPSPDTDPAKLRMRVTDNCQSGLTSSGENVGGPKLCVSSAVLKCLVQKYNMGDIGGRELSEASHETHKLLCSRSAETAESGRLLDVRVPKISDSVSRSSEPTTATTTASLKRKLSEDSVMAEASSTSSSSSPSPSSSSSVSCPASDDSHSGPTESKKAKTEPGLVDARVLSRLSCTTKSFSPKRKWIKESMQDMLEDADPSPDVSSSLPIKQRVKMNLRLIPEERAKADDADGCKRASNGGSGGVSSNFTIEKLCSTEFRREPDSSNFCGWRSPCTLTAAESNYVPPATALSNQPLILPTRLLPDIIPYRDPSPTMTTEYPLNLPLKEEKVSDGEDVDVDVLSTTPVEKKSFDFPGYNFGKRRSFSVQFKLTVLDAFYNDKDCNKNQRATARKFNINRRQVQKWLSQESDLRSESSLKNGKYLQRQRLGSEGRDVVPSGPDGCARCPQHCLGVGKREPDVVAFGQTIEVNVKHCSDRECLTGGDRYEADHTKSRLAGGGVVVGGGGTPDLFNKSLFPGDLKTATTDFYHQYLYPENNNMVYHDSIFGWPHLNSSALGVPNFQCLSTWHHHRHNFDFCQENAKIY